MSFYLKNFSAQPGYAAVPTADAQAAYGAQRPAYAYQTAATQGTYASKNWFQNLFKKKLVNLVTRNWFK